ncbi:MAG: DUF4493 domain-containing protein [Flavobacteriales bacterium]|nr:DUF4493 domain-containing protein [Flavobacteriales bacterium]
MINIKQSKVLGAMMLLLLVIFVGCSKSGVQDYLDKEEGVISLNLKADQAYLAGRAATKASPTVTPSMFRVRVENTRAEVLRTWDSYLDVPAEIRVKPGSYKLVAWYGGDNLPAFDSPYFYGESKISVAGGKDTTTTITARHAATRVYVNFDESFDFNYNKYYVELKTTGDSLRYGKGELRGGYFDPGTLRMRFCLVKENGDSVNYVSPTTLKVAARESYTLNMDVASSAGKTFITIKTDDSTNDTTVVIEMPYFVLPKAAPEVTSTGFNLGETISTTEGVSKQAAMAVKAPGGIKALTIKHDSQYLSSQGLSSEIDLVSASAQVKSVLKGMGLVWSSELDDPNVALSTTSTVYVNFTDFIRSINNLSGSDETTRIELIAEDKYSQKNNQAVLGVKVSPVIFSTVALTSGNIFAKSAEVIMSYVSEREAPVFQVKVGGEWTTPAQKVLSNAGGTIKVRIAGLNPSTQYTFRTAMHSHVYSDEYTFTTEAATQVPNSTMDQWSETTRSYKNWLTTYKIKQVWPYASGESDIWWATRNPASTSQNADPFMENYTANNGTTPVDVNGNTAAKIMSTGWGRGNTNAGNASINYNKTAGMLFIGTYDFTLDGRYLDTETINLGHGFASRPATFGFRYMYQPAGGESFRAYAVLEDRSTGTVKELARAEITDGASVGSMTQKTIPFVYNEEYRYTKATHITIYFISSTAGEPTLNRTENKMRCGSTLTIDDIVLGYDF